MASKQSPFCTRNLTLTGGWDAFTVPNECNALLIQARTSVDVSMSTRVNGVEPFTIKADKGVVVGSFNADNQILYFQGAGGVVVELITIDRP